MSDDMKDLPTKDDDNVKGGINFAKFKAQNPDLSDSQLKTAWAEFNSSNTDTTDRSRNTLR